MALAAGGARPAQAVTISPDTFDDDLTSNGNCTLREAITAANSNTAVDACPAGSAIETDVIPLDPGTYTLTIAGAGEDAAVTGDLDVTDDLTITGAGAASTIIDGGGIDRVFHVSTNVALGVSGVTIRNGNVTGSGGGILKDANTTLTLTNVTVSGNTASLNGGGIMNNASGTLTITNSTISGNTAGGDGGGIDSNGSASTTATDSTFSGNVAGGDGGGINYSAGGTMSVTNSTISGNTASGDGGGINNGAGGSINVTNVTISGNSASNNGGGINNGSSGSINVTSSTISGNTAGVDGGGIHRGGSGSVTLKNTIVANNTSDDCSGIIDSASHNLIENTTGCTIVGDTTGNIIGSDPQLGLLLDNGGPTQTHALPAVSPAIDAGSGDCPPPATDQRGVTRPQGAACDIGAYEFEPPPSATPTPTPTPTSTPTPTPTSTPSPTPTPPPTPSDLPEGGGEPPSGESLEILTIVLLTALAFGLVSVLADARRR